MSGKITIILSAIAGGAVALAVCIIFLFFYFKPAQTAEKMPMNNLSPSPNILLPTAQATIPPLQIKDSEATSISLNTVYTGFFPADSKCRKNYNELFGNEDGIGSSSSPCTFDLTFKRDGSATKTIDLQRYDRQIKEKKSIEKNTWTAKITAEQFAELAKLIVNSEMFKNWNDTMLINVVNSRIEVTYTNGTRTLMSNVDEKTTAFLPLMDTFKKLDSEVKWDK